MSTFFSKLVPWRIWIQTGFLALWLDPLGVRMHGMCSPVFHCYACPLATFACPVGVVAQFSALHVFPFIAIGLLVAVGIIFGTIICGWMCPFGLLQDLCAKIPTPKYDLPKWTGYGRYVVLIVAVLAVPYFFGKEHFLFICRICPAGGLEAAVPNMANQALAGQVITWPNAIKLSIIVLFLIAVFFVKRPWCRVLCPLGGFFSLFNRFSMFFLKLDKDKCTDCNRCHKLCEYGIEPNRNITDSRCIRCLECTQCGPDALTIGHVFEDTKPTNKSAMN